MAAPPTSAADSAASQSEQQSELFRAIDAYPWHSDAEFQAGLSAIVGANSDPQQVERLTLRARCFYYARKHGVNVDFAAYQAWHAQNGSSDAAVAGKGAADAAATSHPTEGLMRPTEATVAAVEGQTTEPPPYPMSFQEIVELISSGKPIPGIKDIPETLLKGQSTEASKPKRRKPWEKDEAAVDSNDLAPSS